MAEKKENASPGRSQAESADGRSAECRRESCTGRHAGNIRLRIMCIRTAEGVNERGADGCDTTKRRADDTKSGSALLCYIISHCINLL